MKRRKFLSKSALISALLPAYCEAQAAPDRFQIALSQYSLRALLKDGSLNALDFPAFTADTFGIKAIDLWEGGLPQDKLDNDAYLDKMKARAQKAGTDLFLLMANPLDAAADKRAASLAGILKSLDRAEKLDVDFLRVFLRAPGKEEQAGLEASVEALKPLADAAAKKNIIIAIEPGASELSAKGTFLAKVATTLNHPACKLMPDFGKQKNNVYDGTQAMLPHTVTISCKMHSFDENGNQPDFDYPRLIKMIADSGYKGYLAIEWEGSALKPVEGVKASQALIARSLASL